MVRPHALRLALALWLCSLLTIATPSFASDKALWAEHDPNSIETVDNDLWNAFLERYLVMPADGIARVRYGDVTLTDQNAVKIYIGYLETIDVLSLNRDEQFAFWVNLYNAAIVDLILENYPLKDIRSVKASFFARGPWGMTIATIAGEDLSFEDVEHNILRRYWQEPRVHYALNCASLSCPNLQRTAFSSANLEVMLKKAARDYINHPRGARVEKGRLQVSSIYKWFRSDFGKGYKGVITHLKAHANPKLMIQLKDVDTVASHDYDWSLNDAATIPAAPQGRIHE